MPTIGSVSKFTQNDAYGLEHEGELGKTECWYIIAADEGSEIIYGHNAKSKEELQPANRR